MTPEPISPQNARATTWHEVCTAWDLVDRSDLTVVQELMPAGTAANPHSHERSRQFFYVLRGEGTLMVGARPVALPAGSGLEVAARTEHHMRNDSDEDLEFIVVTTPRDAGHKHVRPEPTRDRGDLVVGSYLRPTRDSDLPAVVAIEQAQDTARWLGTGGLEWHQQVLADLDTEHWALVDRLDRVVAFGILADHGQAGSLELRRMAVAPAGRGQGLGRVLVRKLLEQALVRPQVERIWLEVNGANTRARSLYRAFGFVEHPAPQGTTISEDAVYLVWEDRTGR